MKQIDPLALCRIDGQKPTVRERWQSFYRVWRMIRNHCPGQIWMQAEVDFRCLFGATPGGWRWCRLLSDFDDLADRHCMPVAIRWSMVRTARQKRELARKRASAERLLEAIFSPV